MKIFQPASRRQAFLKAGLFGFEGSGKTTTAALWAIGLHRHAKLEKPVAFFDTETGADFVAPLFDAAKIPLVIVRTRAVKRLGQAIVEAEKECSILIVDSLTHVYRELTSSYVKAKRGGGKYIDIRDWGPIKEAWAEHFATPYVNSRLHMIWCSRAKNIFEDVEDDEQSSDGKQRFRSVRVGTGARSETESAYEPNLLGELVRKFGDRGDRTRVLTIHKDRTNTIMDRSFEYSGATTERLLEENGPFRDILPHVAFLNLGGEHVGFDNDTSEEMFKGAAGERDVHRRRAVALEEIEASLTAVAPGYSGAEKAAKVSILEGIFGTASWTEIKGKRLDLLEAGSRAAELVRFNIAEGASIHDPGALAAMANRCMKTAWTRGETMFDRSGQPKEKKASEKKAAAQ